MEKLWELALVMTATSQLKKQEKVEYCPHCGKVI